MKRHHAVFKKAPLFLIFSLFTFALFPSLASAVIDVSISSETVTEGTATVKFTVTIASGTASGTERFNWVASDNTAFEVDGDYNDAGGGQVTFNNLETVGAFRTFQITIGNDLLVEDNEIFDVKLTPVGPGGDKVNGNPAGDTVTCTITDNDTGTVSITANDATAAEPNNNGQFTVSLSKQSDTATTVSYTVTGTATSGSDYTALSGSMTIPALTSSVMIDVSVIDNNLVESDETVVVTLNSVTSGDADISIAGAPNNAATVTISDNDTYNVSISNVATSPVTEDPTNVTFTVSLSNVDPAYNVIGTVSVNYATGDSGSNPAVAGSDYTSTSGTLTFSGSTTSQSVNVPILEDILVEDPETFGFQLSSFTGTKAGSITGTNPEIVTINDDDDKYNVSISSVSKSTVQEGTDSSVTFTISLNNVDVLVVGSVSVNYATGGGTATAGGDYSSSSGTLTFNSGTGSSQQVTVNLLNDTLLESAETFNFTLSNFSGSSAGTITGTNPQTITINDNDYKITASAGANGSILLSGDVGVEPATSKTFTITPNTTNYFYVIKQIKVDGTAISGYPAQGAKTYTFTNVTTDHTISATFDDHGYSCDATATTVSTGTIASPYKVNGSITAPIGGVDDVDYFKLVLTGGGGILTVYTTGTTDTEGYLLDASCVEQEQVLVDYDNQGNPVYQTVNRFLAWADGGFTGNNKNFKYELDLGSGTYYIKVRHHQAAGTGAYTLNIALDQDDHGDGCFDNPTVVACGSLTSPGQANGAIKPAGDRDYFKIVLNQPALLKVYTDNLTGTQMDPFGYLYDENCSEITHHDNIATKNTNFNIEEVLSGGTYYVRVEHANASRTGGYRLNVVCTNAHQIYATSTYGATISPAGTVIVAEGDSKTFNIEAKVSEGFYISNVLVDSVPVTVPPLATTFSYTFTNVTTDHTIKAIISRPPEACLDISDTPLDVRKHSAPANIMVLLDDSQSLDWEFMTEEADGVFHVGNTEYYYVYNLQDRVYQHGKGSAVLADSDKMMWKSQWAGVNKIFYDPSVGYDPWPTYAHANPNSPYSRPDVSTYSINLSDTFISLDARVAVIVDNKDSNFTYTSSIPGGWDWATDSTAFNEHYWYTPTPLFPRNFTATWTPNLAAGQYNVYARWRAWPSRSTSVPYTITYSGGASTPVNVNQRENGGQWVSLGTYDFDEGAGSVSINLTNYNTSLNGTVCADAVKFVPTGAKPFNIPNAHYYTWYDANGNNTIDRKEVYLVIIDGSIKYYQVDDVDGDERVEDTELSLVTSPPDAVKSTRSYSGDDGERQNFANWFSFYRKRDLLTRAAVAQVITNIKGVKVGFRGIQGSVNQPVLPVKVGNEDNTGVLLTRLYGYRLDVKNAMTPLRRGFEDLGKYFDMTDDEDDDPIGPSPIATEEEGGGCQQNFAIIFSDAYYVGGPPQVGNADGDNNTAFDGVPPYRDDASNTMADVAMHFYERDLAPGVSNQVPTNPFDSATHQHLVTYAVTFGVYGNLNPKNYDLEKCKEEGIDGQGNCPPWPVPITAQSDKRKKIDDLWHAAVNGRGEFHSASNVEELVQAFLAVMQNIESRIGSAAAVSVNGDELYGTIGADVRMFQSSYSSDGWIGDVKAYGLDDDGKVITTSWLFSAAEELEKVGYNDRIIVTFDNTSSGIPFRVEDLTSDQKDLLENSWDTSGVTTIVNYLRGQRTNEKQNGGFFRDRYQKLGDIVHSSPTHKNNVLYAGGNDGMMHAFSAEDGKELFAYVPNLVFENLKKFADPNYSHLYFVDLTPITKDITVSDVNKTIVVGGLGKGGKGYYCLDISGVTNSTIIQSENDLKSRVRWEYPNSGVTEMDTDDLGFSYSVPSIVESNDTTNAPWIMIFGNGYNSINSRAVLFILDPWNGTLIKKIDTLETGEGEGGCNGLSTPLAIDPDFDGKVDYVYAGDLYGNLWKFDLTSNDYTNWDVAYKSGTTLSGTTPQPLFQAKDENGNPQPITTKPDAMFHCEAEDGKPGFMVVTGTGRYLGESDFLYNSTQTIYGLWDYGDDDDDREYLGSFNRTSGTRLSNQPSTVTLLEQTEIAGNFTTPSGLAIRILTNYTPVYSIQDDTDTGQQDPQPDPGPPVTCSNNLDDDNDGATDEADECTSHAGWFYDVPAGERVANDLIIREGKIVMIGFSPEETPCGTSGWSTVMELDACTGGRLTEAQLDINEDGVIDNKDLINIGTEENPEWVVPTGIEYPGRLMAPAILRDPFKDEEIKYFSTSVGSIIMLKERAVKLGISYWIEFE